MSLPKFVILQKQYVMLSSLIDRITINPEIAHDKPTIRNMRYTVEGMLEYLAGGDSFDDLLNEFPDLEKEDLQACLLYKTKTKLL